MLSLRVALLVIALVFAIVAIAAPWHRDRLFATAFAVFLLAELTT